MTDPYARLTILLDAFFNSVAQRNGKYLIEPIQKLKDEMGSYNPKSKHSFFSLIDAFGACAPYFAQRKGSLNDLLSTLNQLARVHGVQYQELKAVFVELKIHDAKPSIAQEKPLMPWLSETTGRPFNRLNHKEQTDILVKECQQAGFSQKLSQHLEKNPEFLMNLINKSQKNFQKIAGSRLNLYLTDKQMAEAIVMYLPKYCEGMDASKPDVGVISAKIDALLSNGRSINALLRNSDARSVLEQSPWFAEQAEPSRTMAP